LQRVRLEALPSGPLAGVEPQETRLRVRHGVRRLRGTDTGAGERTGQVPGVQYGEQEETDEGVPQAPP